MGITPTRSRRRMKHLKHETSTKHQCAATITLEMTGGEAGPSAAHTGLDAAAGLVTRFAMGSINSQIDAKIDHPHRPHWASLRICNRGSTPEISRRPSGPMRCRRHFSSTHAGPLRGRFRVLRQASPSLTSDRHLARLPHSEEVDPEGNLYVCPGGKEGWPVTGGHDLIVAFRNAIDPASP